MDSWKCINYKKEEISNEYNIIETSTNDFIKNLLKYNKKDFLSEFFNKIYEINNFYNLTKIMQFIKFDEIKKEWLNYEGKIYDLRFNFFNNNQIYNIINDILENYDISSDDKILLNKIIITMKFNGAHISDDHKARKFKNVANVLKTLELRVIEKLYSGNIINLNKNDRIQYPNSNNQYVINFDNYSHYVFNIENINKLNEINDVYYKQLDIVAKDIIKIAICRDEIAKLAGFDSFFFYKTQKNEADATSFKTFIEKLILQINEQHKKEVNSLSHSIKKINLTTIENFKATNNKINFNKALTYLLKFISELFGINFVPTNSMFKWNNDIDTLFITDSNNKLYGTLYLDLLASQNKPIQPIAFSISEKWNYPYDINNTNPSMIIFGNYTPNSDISFSEFITFSHVLGNTLQKIINKNKYACSNIESDFNNFFGFILECIVKDEQFIKLINTNINVNIDTCTQIKLDCIYSLFDHVLHNSKNFIDLSKKIIKETDNNYSSTLKNIYKEIYNSYININNTSLNFSTHINPLFIYNIVTGFESMWYNNIFNKMCANNIYEIIKSKNNGHYLRKNVLENPLLPLKDSVLLFIDKEKINNNKIKIIR